MRYFVLALPILLAACATNSGSSGNVAIETVSAGQPLVGANCVVSNNSGRWTVVTPAAAPVGSSNGDLRVICDKNGYRTSEVVYRPSNHTGSNIGIGVGGGGGRVGVGLGLGIPIGMGGGSYPATVTVEMNPQ